MYTEHNFDGVVLRNFELVLLSKLIEMNLKCIQTHSNSLRKVFTSEVFSDRRGYANLIFFKWSLGL